MKDIEILTRENEDFSQSDLKNVEPDDLIDYLSSLMLVTDKIRNVINESNNSVEEECINKWENNCHRIVEKFNNKYFVQSKKDKTYLYHFYAVHIDDNRTILANYDEFCMSVDDGSYSFNKEYRTKLCALQINGFKSHYFEYYKDYFGDIKEISKEHYDAEIMEVVKNNLN